MATSGYTDVGVTKYDTLRFSWSRTSYAPANNTSTISWVLQLISSANGAISSTANKSWSVNVNGTGYSGTNKITIGNNSTISLASGSTTIAHNSDGTKSFAYSFSQEFGIKFGGSTINTVSGSGTSTLDRIPRASSVTVTSGKIGSNITVSINSASSSFIHHVQYKFGSSSPWNNMLPLVHGGSHTFTIFDSFYDQIPNSKSGTCTVQCITYASADNLDKIGVSTCSFSYYVDENVCKPTLDPTAVDQETISETLTGSPDKIIKFFNKIDITFNAAAHKSATIKSMNVTCGTKSRTSDGLLENVDDGSFIFSVTDSRGYTVSKTITKEIIDYFPLTCYLYAVPKLVDGASARIDLTINGNFFNGSFGSIDNILNVQYRYKINDGEYPNEWTAIVPNISDGKYSSQLSIPDLDYTNSYTIQARASDKVNTGWITTTEQVVRIVPVFDWGKNDFNFNVPVHCRGGLTYDTQIKSNGDCNEIVISGDYYIGTTGTNKPVPELDGWLTVKGYSDTNFCYQQYITQSGVKYERWKKDGTWEPWIKLARTMIISGSDVVSFSNSNRILLTNFDKLKALFIAKYGIAPASNMNIGVAVSNGDYNASHTNIKATFWQGTNLYLDLETSISGNYRINYAFMSTI